MLELVPNVDEKRPRPQLVHALADAVECLPSGQLLQALALARYLLAAQTLHVLAPALLTAPLAQLAHTDCPVLLLYFPAAQSGHTTVLVEGAYCPTGQA